MSAANEFQPLSLCVLTVSDTRSAANDGSGDYLCGALAEAGHRLHERAVVRDDKYALRAIVSRWIADDAVHGILVNGGTGFTGRDSTPEALLPLLDKPMPGFGEMFRVLKDKEVKTSFRVCMIDHNDRYGSKYNKASHVGGFVFYCICPSL